MFRPTRSTGITVVLAIVLALVEAAVAAEKRQRPIRSPTYPTPAPNLQRCLHGADESAEQSGRRRQALALSRAINTAQMRHRTGGGTFIDSASLMADPDVGAVASGQGDQIAPGWRLQLVTTGDTSLLSIKDSTDPCHFAYFSDDEGLIYTANPIR